MKHTNLKTMGAALAAGSLAIFFLFSACSPKKDVAAKGKQPVQYRLKMKDKDGNYTYSKTVTVYE